MSLAIRLANFALTPAEPSSEAAEILRLSCLDWAACALAGVDEPVAQHLSEQAAAEGGRKDAGVIGGGRVPARAAALVNGATSHALDYDDTHFAHIGHPSVAVFPAALAMAEREGRDMGEFLTAALLGVEASVRVGVWLGRGHYQVGFHQTATAGAFGATVAAARLAGLSEEETGHALALTATKAAGIKAQFGTMGKPLNAGLAAECGVMAVDWAKAGLRSDLAALDGPGGFAATHHGAEDMSAFDGMGDVWRFADVSHKLHACCHGLHATLEALRDLEARPEKLEIFTHPRWMSVCNIPAPATGLEAKFSYRIVAAMALSGIDTSAIESFSDDLAARSDLAGIMARITVTADDCLSEVQSRVLADGALLQHDLAAPIPLETRVARVRAKARALTPRAEALEAAIEGGDMRAFRTALFD